MKIIENSAIFDVEKPPFDYRFDGAEFYYRKNSRYSIRRPLFLEPPIRELIFATGVYEADLLPGAHYLRRNAPFLSVEYVQEGNLYVRVDGRMYELSAGDVVLMHPFGTGEFMTGREFRCRKISVALHGRLLGEFLKQSGIDRTDVPENVNTTRLEELFSRLSELADRHGREVERRNGLLSYELLQFLQAPTRPRERPEKLTAILNYLAAHLAEPISLEMLAARYGCSRNHLINLFREYLRETPHQVLISLRMRKARELLLSHETLSIKEITARIGYSNALNFSTEFRKRFKLSPREYRRIGHGN
jgi:transcriptional regulator, araC family